MQLKTGDRVRVLATGDDRLDWAAGEEGEVTGVRLVRDYLYGIQEPCYLQAEYYSITVATPKGDVTVNDHEVMPIWCQSWQTPR